ncbi:unnamed protein product, partial [Ectocarpus sp. 12 AP-2014]
MSTSDKRRSGMSFAAVSSICNIERRTWLSGRGLAAMAAGFVGTWWFLFYAHKAVGRTRGPWIHPRITRPIHRFRGAFVWGSLFVILLMRGKGEDGEQPIKHSFLEELLGALRGAVPGGPRLLFIEDTLAVIIVAVAARAVRHVWEILASPLAAKQ